MICGRDVCVPCSNDGETHEHLFQLSCGVEVMVCAFASTLGSNECILGRSKCFLVKLLVVLGRIKIVVFVALWGVWEFVVVGGAMGLSFVFLDSS